MNPSMPFFKEIMKDPENEYYTKKGWHPIYTVNKDAKILIIGQAPGKKVQQTEIMWNDKSGDRLRKWMGINRATFYDPTKIAVIPMDFYYPGKAKSGDVPPRKDITAKWHKKLINYMPNLKLIILVGSYSQKYYLSTKDKKLNSTEMIKNYKNYLPKYFPIVHPSPRNNIWLSKNPWFLTKVIPDLKKKVNSILN